MSRENDPMIGRGQTAYGPDQTVASTGSGPADALAGSEKEFEDFVHTEALGAQTSNTGLRTRSRLMRCDISGGITPGLVVNLDGNGKDFTSLATAKSMLTGVVDPYLPTAGCRRYDLCWVDVEGPTRCKSTGGGTITAGTAVEGSTGGQVIQATAAFNSLGYAMETVAATAGIDVRVLLIPRP